MVDYSGNLRIDRCVLHHYIEQNWEVVDWEQTERDYEMEVQGLRSRMLQS